MALSKLHKDKIMSPLDSATYWIEYVIRHKGAYHLQATSRDLWWFQYHLLDVILGFFAFVFAVVWALVKCRRVFSVHGSSKKRKTSENGHTKMESNPRKTSENGHTEMESKTINGYQKETYSAGNIHLVQRRAPKNGLKPNGTLESNGNGHVGNGFSNGTYCSKCYMTLES